MPKRVAIVQSNYIPWKGYFDLIASVDEFILYDDVQYTRRDWRNRNRIKTPQGCQWLSVPVRVSGKYTQRVRDTEIDDPAWGEQHWRSLAHCYGRAPHFAQESGWLEPLYVAKEYRLLSDLNRCLIEAICRRLGIGTTIRNSWDYQLPEGRSERLAGLCVQAGASVYVSGPAAKTYLDESLFAAQGLAVEWFSYDGYREYPQLWGPFEHGVTVLDLLFNCGDASRSYMLAGPR